MHQSRNPGRNTPRRLPWVPLLLTPLLLLLIVGGVAVGHFYWDSLRESMDAMGASLSAARQRQQDFDQRIAQAQARVNAQREQLGIQEANLLRREELLALEREEVAAWRARIAGRLAGTAAKGPDPAAETRRLAIAGAARRVAGAARAVSGGEDVSAAAETLSNVAAELPGLDASLSAQVGPELGRLSTGLIASARIDWPALHGQLEAVSRAAARLPPLGADGDAAIAGDADRDGPAIDAAFRQALQAQLDVAETALVLRDATLLRLAGAGVERMVGAHYPAARPEAKDLEEGLTVLRRQVQAIDRAALAARIEQIAMRLQTRAGTPEGAGADTTAPSAAAAPER